MNKGRVRGKISSHKKALLQWLGPGLMRHIMSGTKPQAICLKEKQRGAQLSESAGEDQERGHGIRERKV